PHEGTPYTRTRRELGPEERSCLRTHPRSMGEHRRMSRLSSRRGTHRTTPRGVVPASPTRQHVPLARQLPKEGCPMTNPDVLRRGLDALTVRISAEFNEIRADLAEVRRIILELKRGVAPDAQNHDLQLRAHQRPSQRGSVPRLQL